MKILFLDSPAFAKQDMIDAFETCGIHCDLFFHEKYNERYHPAFEQAFDNAIQKENYAFVFSFNYYPTLSACCQRHDVKYVSYVYDSPLVALYSCTLINPCNYVFLFDKITFQTFRDSGISTVYYLPLAANPTRLLSLECPVKWLEELTADVSFVGSLYNEDHNLFERLTSLTDYTKGYLDAIMAAQQKVYGYFFIENLLHQNILQDLQASVPYTPMTDGTETAAYVYANYFLARKITSNERLSLLKKISNRFQLKLYTHQPVPEISSAEYMGTVDYYNLMPLVFRNSSININISLKSIHSGIPLRCMDIMGSGGFLLTNYQTDFLDFFTPEEDFIFYENEEDCIQKINYYLSHNTELLQIKENAKCKMLEAHTFIHRVESILSIIL